MQFNRASFISRNFVSTCINCRSHYDSLGVTPHATQADIKAAYYKLSKVYHPDKTKGSNEAIKKFRDITEAYEVLGNLKLRKLYDKGILHTAGPRFQTRDEPVVSEDTYKHAKFYHSRNDPKRVHVRMPDNINKVYNLDEWSQQHYGKMFAKRAAEKKKYEADLVMKSSVRGEKQRNFLMISVAMFIGFCVSLH
ncbi:J domain-containing protein, partial [Candidatus Hodgkinia cicadicola]|uniref:J domain-containing protein n=1 Tax=Candidatus Hodgkinia cicadicola TaxID=573658 RepID=UPI001788A329